jgi:hypothetical protein
MNPFLLLNIINITKMASVSSVSLVQLLSDNTNAWIAYARVSTSSMTGSISSQECDLNECLSSISYLMVLPSIGSVRDGMASTLKSTIKSQCKKSGGNVVLAVTSFDRITRSATDLVFLNKYVKFVVVVRGSQIVRPDEYEVCINEAQAELKTMVDRAIRSNQVTARVKPPISKPDKAECVRRSVVRLNHALNAIQNSPVNEMMQTHHEHVQEFIKQSQSLCGLKDWMNLSMLSLRLSDGKISVMDEYVDNVNSVNSKTMNLSRADVLHYVNRFRVFSSVSDSVTKEYVNATLQYVLLVV